MADQEPTIGDVLAAITKMRTDIMARVDRLQDAVTALARDFQNTKGFLIDDALTLGRRVSGVENRLDDLDKDGG